MGNVTLVIDAESAKAVQAFVQLENKQEALKRKQESLSQSGAQGMRRHRTAVEDLSSSVGSLATRYLGAAAGGAALLRVVRDVVAENRKAAQGLRDAEASGGALAQLSGGSVAELRRMLKASGMTEREAGVAAPRARGLQFALESMGLAGERETFAQAFDITEQPQQLAEGVATLQGAMGRERTGPARTVLNKLLAASAVSKTTLEQFAPAASGAAKSVQMAGGKDTEFLAALAEMSKSTKDAEVAATQIDAFARATVKMGLTEEGLLARAQRIQKRGFSDKQLLELFGRVEGVKGFKGLIAQQGDIQRTQAAVETAGAGTGTDADLMSRIITARRNTGELEAARTTRVAEQTAEGEKRRRYGPGEMAVQRGIATMETGYPEGLPQFLRTLDMAMVKFNGFMTSAFGGSEAFEKSMARRAHILRGGIMGRAAVQDDDTQPAAGMGRAAVQHVVVDDDISRGARPSRTAGTE